MWWCWKWKILNVNSLLLCANGGIIGTDIYEPMDDPPKDLYIITTARKRDTCEWDGELAPFLLSTHDDVNLYSNKVIVDSWNNVKKYSEVRMLSLYLMSKELLVAEHG